jgi:hypothetical protein
MSFNNSELNHGRQGWDKNRQVSDTTDPDYADKVEQRFLKDLLTLNEAEQKIALEGYSRKKRKEMVAQLEQMRKDIK